MAGKAWSQGIRAGFVVDMGVATILTYQSFVFFSCSLAPASAAAAAAAAAACASASFFASAAAACLSASAAACRPANGGVVMGGGW